MPRLKPFVPALLALGCATTMPAVTVRPDAQLAGTWRGAVVLPNGPLSFVAHVGVDGTGTVDVPAQGAEGLPLRVVRSEGSAFELLNDLPGAPAVLAGNRDGDVLRGTFKQRGYEFPFELHRDGAAAAESAPPEGIASPELLAGPWHGAVVVGAQQLPFDVAFAASAATGTFAVPAQGLRGLPLEDVTFDGTRLVFRVPLPDGQHGRFEGTLRESRIDGSYAQGGGTSAFSMTRGERPAEKAAPSDVHDTHEVSIPNGAVTLSGTLTLPKGVTRPPVAVLISGSGPQTRDEEVAGFRIFEALAHALAKGGVATLRYDDRGIGRSTGDFRTATTEDFAADAEAAFRFLRSRTDVDTRRIGLVGHSEGAVVAPMVASRASDVAYLVLLAPPAQNLGDLVVDQIGPASRAEGLPAERIEANERMMRQAVALLRAGKDLASMEATLAEACAPACRPGDAMVSALRRSFETPWFRAMVRLDPATYLSRVTVPVLALAGALDVQVPGDRNLPLLRTIAAASKGTFIVEEIAGMNHVLQAAKTGAASEYATLPTELEPRVPARILSWLAEAVPSR